MTGDFVAGRDNLSLAMHYPNAIGNPFLQLRLGQCQFELANLDRAADELTRAYMDGGSELFDGADKYVSFLNSRRARRAGRFNSTSFPNERLVAPSKSVDAFEYPRSRASVFDPFVLIVPFVVKNSNSIESKGSVQSGLFDLRLVRKAIDVQSRLGYH